MQYSKIQIDYGTKKESVKTKKSEMLTRTDHTRQNPAKSWSDPTRGFILPVDNSALSNST